MEKLQVAFDNFSIAVGVLFKALEPAMIELLALLNDIDGEMRYQAMLDEVTRRCKERG